MVAINKAQVSLEYAFIIVISIIIGIYAVIYPSGLGIVALSDAAVKSDLQVIGSSLLHSSKLVASGGEGTINTLYAQVSNTNFEFINDTLTIYTPSNENIGNITIIFPLNVTNGSSSNFSYNYTDSTNITITIEKQGGLLEIAFN